MLRRSLLTRLAAEDAAGGRSAAKARRTTIGGSVTDPFYVSRASVSKVEGVHRRATLADGTELDMGVHGPVKSHYRIDAKDLPLPVDYQVATTGG